jgi:hypothetical protein
MTGHELASVALTLVAEGKGILAADEPSPNRLGGSPAGAVASGQPQRGGD